MEQSDISDIQLTRSQENVLTQILDFVNDSTDRVFILKGYAGTGKTTLMRFLIKSLAEKEKRYRLLASKGRAAKVLANLSEALGRLPRSIRWFMSLIVSTKSLRKKRNQRLIRMASFFWCLNLLNWTRTAFQKQCISSMRHRWCLMSPRRMWPKLSLVMDDSWKSCWSTTHALVVSLYL